MVVVQCYCQHLPLEPRLHFTTTTHAAQSNAHAVLNRERVVRGCCWFWSLWRWSGSLGQVLHRFEASGSHVGLALEATKRLVILVFWTPAPPRCPPSQTVPLKYISVHERRAQEGACSIISKSARQELGRERGRCEFKRGS